MTDVPLQFPSREFPTLFVAPHASDYGSKPGGGSNVTLASEVVERARESLQHNLAQIVTRMTSPGFGPQSYGLARLKLRGGAIAKSDRPRKMFGADTCQILGDWGDPGELLVLVSPQGVRNLSERVSRLRGHDAEKLVNVESFGLVEPSRRLSGRVRQILRRELESNGQVHIKVRTLHDDLWGSITESQVAANLSDVTGQPQHAYLRFHQFGVYGITIHDLQLAEQLAALWFVTTLDIMPTYSPMDLYLSNLELHQVILDRSVDIDQLRTVLVFDGGIDSSGPLGPLIYAVEPFEDDVCLDVAHGTGVASQVARRPDSTAEMLIPRTRLIDVRGVPKKGSGHFLTEDVLVERLEYCAERYGRIAEEWNLSLAANPGPQRKTFSDIAMYLDNLHKRFGMTFFCSPGNCSPRDWPPTGNRDDYVAAPGDAVCAMTVGASVPDDSPPEATTPAGAPSPFSPRGPVAHSIAKPDIIAPGGNIYGKQTIGVPILGANGQWTTGVGTSYSTPTATGAGAELAAFLSAGGIPSHYKQEDLDGVRLGLLMRSLLIHHAHLAEVGLLTGNAPLDDYRGFGELPTLEEVLLDPSWRSTSVIYARLRPKQNLVMDYFPFPQSLHAENLYWGHAIVTMASEPLLDPSFTYEYVRSNVDVHFGVIEHKERIVTNSDGTETRRLDPVFASQIHDTFTPPKNESRLILDEHKWSPVKKYESKPLFRCIGNYWRLKAELLLRDKESDALEADPSLVDDLTVDVAIVVTLGDPQRNAPVNSEVFTEWQMRGHVPASIPLRPRIPLKWE